MPSSWARAAESNADCTIASRVTALASRGAGDAAFSSISLVSSSWSSEPQFAPMRTGLSFLLAISMMSANCVSRLFLKPTLPGLMRYLSRASAQAVADMRNGGRGFLAIDRDAHHFRTGARQRSDLRDRAFDIGGVGIGHRLHDDRRTAADGDIADHDLGGLMPGLGAGNVVLLDHFGLVHGGLEYQVLVTFTKGAAKAQCASSHREFFALYSIA